MAPPTSPIPLSPYERDGQEYGLVPKYLLRKSTNRVKEEKNGESSSNGDNPAEENPASLAAAVMKDSVAEEIPHKSPEEVAELVKETDALLARRWRVSTLVDSPSFESEKELLLATEEYQPQRAANRIEEHWKTKMELFGSTLVDKKIALFDLSSEKSEIGVEDGYVQLLPARDLAGRAIIFFQYDSVLYPKQPKSFRKIMYYMMASAFEDEETVRKGLTLVVWNGSPKWFDPFWNAFHKLSSPFKISKLHYCQETHDSPYSVQEKLEKETDVRIHKGSLHECLHGLVTYGVPSHFMPFTPDGSIDVKEHLKWIDLRRRIESFPPAQQRGLVLVPSKEDVLMGKRKLSMHGNVYFHQMVASNVEAYHNAGDDEHAKEKICLNVWTAVTTTRGGRFLMQVEDGQLWERLEIQSALHKINQAFEFLCQQYYAPRDGTLATTSGNNRDSHLYVDWNEILMGKQCWNLVHCKVGPSCF